MLVKSKGFYYEIASDKLVGFICHRITYGEHALAESYGVVIENPDFKNEIPNIDKFKKKDYYRLLRQIISERQKDSI